MEVASPWNPYHEKSLLNPKPVFVCNEPPISQNITLNCTKNSDGKWTLSEQAENGTNMTFRAKQPRNNEGTFRAKQPRNNEGKPCQMHFNKSNL